MSSPPFSPPTNLAELLDASREVVVQRWTARYRQELGEASLRRSGLVDSLPQFLEALATSLRRGAPAGGVTGAPREVSLAQAHGRPRHPAGQQMTDLLWEYALLQDVLLDLADEAGLPLRAQELRVLLHGLHTGLVETVLQFTREREAQLRAAEQAVRDREERYRGLTGASFDGLLLHDGEQVLEANEAFARMFGYTLEEVRGRSPSDFVAPDSLAAVQWAVTGGREDMYEAVGVHRDGTRLDLELIGHTLEYRGRRVRAAAVRDVTRRKQAERALRESEERFRLLVEGVHDVALILLDPQGRVASWNAGAERIKGYRAEEVLGQPISRFYPEEDVARGEPAQTLEEAARTGRVAREAVRVRKDGSRFWAHVVLTALRDEEGRLRGFAKLTRDVTERKEAEARQAFFIEAGRLLAESLELTPTLQRLAHLVVQHLADYCTVDLLGEDGELHRLEVAARDPAREPLIRRTMPHPPLVGANTVMARALAEDRLVAEDDITPAWLERMARNPAHRQALEALGPRSVVFVPLVARGRRLGLLNVVWTRPGMCTPFNTEMARVVADRAAVAIDNTRLYQQAREAAAVREELLAVVSHDLRTPLNAITLSAGALLKRGGLTDWQARALQRIDAAALRAGRLIHELLDFTRVRVGGLQLERQPLDLQALVRRVVEEVQAAHPDRQVELEAPGQLPGAWDEGRVAQVLTNLVGNALQHSPPDTAVRVACRAEGVEAVLTVHNVGVPIPPELLEVLFQPFRRGGGEGARAPGGLGLGLYITQQIVLAHGGRIDVVSTAEAGTTVTVRLPRQIPG